MINMDFITICVCLIRRLLRKLKKANVTLAILKVDSENLQKGLSDAGFQLYEDPNCTIKAGEQQTTDASGKAEFVSLLPHHTYYLKEVSAPEDYNLKSDIITVRTEENNQTLSTLKIENNPVGWDEKAAIQILKTNEDGSKPLEGARFALYRKDQVTLVGEQTTGTDGICSFIGLKEGTYYLKEMQAPKGYDLSLDWIPVTVSENTVLPVTVTNKELLPPPISGETDSPSNPGNSGSGGESHSSGGSGSGGNSPQSVSPKVTEQETKTITSADQIVPESHLEKASRIPKTGVILYSGLWLTGAITSCFSAIILCIYWCMRKRKADSGCK